MIIVSTTRWAMPGSEFCSRSRRMAPAGQQQRKGKRSVKLGQRKMSWQFYFLPCAICVILYLSFIRVSLPQVSRRNRLVEFTMRDGTSELQQAAERQGGHMRLPPAICLLLHVLFKLDPASSLLPAHFMIFLHNQLVQLHKQLRNKIQTNHSEDLWRLGVKAKVFL